MKVLSDIAISAWNYAVSWFGGAIGDSPINIAGILIWIAVGFVGVYFYFGSSILPADRKSNRFTHALKNIFPLRRDYWQTAKQDMTLYLVNNLALGIFAVLLLPITNDVYRDWLSLHLHSFLTKSFGSYRLPVSNGFTLDLTYSFCLIFFNDLGRYIAHRALHKIPALWEFHKVHHSAATLNPLAFFRLHFVEIAITQISIGIVAGIVVGFFKTFCGTAPSTATLGNVAILSTLFAFTGVLRHSHIWWSYGKLEVFISSPAMHLIHHSMDPKHYDKNFAGDFSFWDLVFGSIYKTEREPPANLKFGIKDNFNWSKATAWQFVWSPIRRAGALIFKGKPPTSNGVNHREAA